MPYDFPEVVHVENGITKRLLNCRDAAEYLSISQDTLRQLVWNGKLPIVKHSDLRGSKWWFDIRDLDAYVDQNKTYMAD